MGGLETGSIIAGHRIEGVAGRGGMGIVYRARHLALNRAVALKVIAPEHARDAGFRERFKRESELAASLDHPHIVPIYHAGEEAGLLYVTMRYVEGTDLGRLLDQRGRLPAQLATAIVAQIADALDAAHENGLVHRDVKPANILLSDSRGTPHAYLTDFGLTKAASGATQGLTQTGTVIGSLDYIAPEQLQGGPVDARCDEYELGCVLFHALTGRVPFPEETITSKMWGHLSKPVPSARQLVPGLPEELDRTVRRAMAKQPQQRFRSTGEFARAAVSALPAPEPRTIVTSNPGLVQGSWPPPTQPPPPSQNLPPRSPSGPGNRPRSWPPADSGPTAVQQPKPGRKKMLLAGAALAIVVAATVGAVLWLGGGGDDPPKPPELPVIGAVKGDPIPVGLSPLNGESAGGYVWVSNNGEDSVSRIDERTRESEKITIEDGRPGKIALDQDDPTTIWVMPWLDAIVPIDVASGRLGESVNFGKNLDSLAVGGGYVWATHTAAGTVTRVDVATGQIKDEIPVGDSPTAITFEGGDAYVLLRDERALVEIDGERGKVVGDPIELNTNIGGDFVIKDGIVYFGNADGIIRFDLADKAVLPPIDVQDFSTAQLDDTHLYVVDSAKDELRRFDLATTTEDARPISGFGHGDDITSIVVEGNNIWLVNNTLNTVSRIQLEK